MSTVETRSIHDRVEAVLTGRVPDRIPFADRLELWFSSMERRNAMPAEYEGMTLTEIHEVIGFGQLRFVFPCAFRLNGVELVTSFDGDVVSTESDPEVERLASLLDRTDATRVGMTTFDLRTPVGTLRMRHELLHEAWLWGEIPYLCESGIKGPDDYAVVDWILDRIEFVPRYDRFAQAVEEMGDAGFVVPLLPRIPFQQVLVELVGEVPLFYQLADDSEPALRLVDRLHEITLDMLRCLEEFDYPYVEFADGLTGEMTNPKLFAAHCMEHYQAYAEILHAQGKKMGSHTDGNLKPLLDLIRECGLDVCESFSPAPLTECTFDQAWEAFRDGGPIMWGVVPSPLLEERMPEEELHAFVDHVFETVGRQPIILGISDMVLGNNSIDRVRWIVERVEGNVL